MKRTHKTIRKEKVFMSVNVTLASIKDTCQLTPNENNQSVEGIDFVKICEGLFLGNQKSAQDPSFIKNRKITYIINSASKDCPSVEHPNVAYFNISISDEMDASIAPYLFRAVHFIKQAHKDGENVLSHCEKGLSRSVSIVIAYLISEKKMNYRAALNTVIAVRPHAQPNPTFVQELKDFWLSTKMQQVSKPSVFSMKECLLNNALWLDWDVYKSIHDYEGIEVGYTTSGRWGIGAAGVLVTSTNPTPEFLLFKRSKYVEQPGEWSIPGGARKTNQDGELTNPLNTAISELREEAGLPRGSICTTPIIYDSEDYSYYTYILNIEYGKVCYTPRLNWENSECKWFSKEELLKLPTLHKGVRFVIDQL